MVQASDHPDRNDVTFQSQTKHTCDHITLHTPITLRHFQNLGNKLWNTRFITLEINYPTETFRDQLNPTRTSFLHYRQHRQTQED